MDIQNTMKFGVGHDRSKEVREAMRCVYNSLTEKGYDPVSQIVGYIMSGDPTYITSHNNARVLITKLDRDELMEELVKYYIKSFEE